MSAITQKHRRRTRHERPGRTGRQVFGPHPWRERLRKAREGSPRAFLAERDIYGYHCPRCDAQLGIAGPLETVEDYEAQEYYDSEVAYHESGDCVGAMA